MQRAWESSRRVGLGLSLGRSRCLLAGSAVSRLLKLGSKSKPMNFYKAELYYEPISNDPMYDCMLTVCMTILLTSHRSDWCSLVEQGRHVARQRGSSMRPRVPPWLMMYHDWAHRSIVQQDIAQEAAVESHLQRLSRQSQSPRYC